ncbi:ABC transporter ATP-binding protein [Aeromonas cavernicola]|uniref:Lipoprotein-releasing system ATP-binding protein LolD n=1 Tax=Aeromonas cavernicola TaxID=1006623 RepID=A0A2H9U0J2_9GAMM|nr:ABC transporter ATP-binding protein [Aeromonas cavernicola]PJG57468.1 lipoprotein-releasing system ATP-binding protein LolD [Aeromonas cavernicola]
MTPSLPRLALCNVTKSYRVGGEQINALRNIQLTVPAGAFIAIRGPSGSGKSSLLNICGLLDSPDSGSVLLEGKEVGKLDELARTQLRRDYLGFVFQSYNLVPVMTARDNIEYPLLLGNLPARERRRRVDRLLEQVGLAGIADRRPDQLSGGQRQRVAIARALIKAPLLVIADEPTANLDTRTANQVIDLMKALGAEQSVTFLIATHDDRMTRHCDQIHVMTDGALR